MPIYLAECNTPLTIIKITGTDKIKKHLNNLGITTGETVEVVNVVNENIILKVKGVTMALSNELAKRILV